MNFKNTVATLLTSLAFIWPVKNTVAQTSNDVSAIFQTKLCTGWYIEGMVWSVSDYDTEKLFQKIGKSYESLEKLRELWKTNVQIFDEYLPASERTQIHTILDREIACQIQAIQAASINWKDTPTYNIVSKINWLILNYEWYIESAKTYWLDTEKYKKTLSTILSPGDVKEIQYLKYANSNLIAMREFPNKIEFENLRNFNWYYNGFIRDTSKLDISHSKRIQEKIKEFQELAPQYLIKQLKWMDSLTEFLIKEGASPHDIEGRLGWFDKPKNAFIELQERWKIIIREAEKFSSLPEIQQQLETSKIWLNKYENILDQLKKESDTKIAEFLVQEKKRNAEFQEFIQKQKNEMKKEN